MIVVNRINEALLNVTYSCQSLGGSSVVSLSIFYSVLMLYILYIYSVPLMYIWCTVPLYHHSPEFALL